MISKNGIRKNIHPRQTNATGKRMIPLLILIAVVCVSLNLSESKADTAPVIPGVDYFYGTWVAASCAGIYYMELRSDGTTSTRLARKSGGPPVHVSNGTWKIRGDSIVWTYDRGTSRTPRGAEDVNKIVRIERDLFTVVETDGRRTSLTRVK